MVKRGTVLLARGVRAATIVSLLGSAIAVQTAEAEFRCASSGETVRANKVARVFTISHPGSRVYYGCSRDTEHVHRLIRVRRGTEFLEHRRLAGRYFAAEFWHMDFHESIIGLWDLRGGRKILSVAIEDEFADDVEVTRRGGVAWMTDFGFIRKCDRDGQAKLGETLGKLTRRGQTVYWRSGGEQHSYLLRGRAGDRVC
jgi:hypothetical protein